MAVSSELIINAKFKGDQAQRGLSKLDKTGQRLAGTFAAAFGGAALIRFTSNAAKAFIEVEKLQREVQTLASFTTQEIDKMVRGSEQLRRAFGATASEIEKARFDVVSSGFASVAEQQTILTAALKLGAANATDNATATRVLTSTLAAFQLSASDTTMAMDQLTASAQGSKESLQSIGPAIASIAPAAAIAGQNLASVGAALDVLTLSGESADEAATKIRATFLTLIKPDTITKLEDLGIKVQDANGNLLPMLDILRKLKPLAPAALGQVFIERRALLGVKQLTSQLDLFEDKLNDIQTANGNTAVSFQKMQATASFRLGQLGESFNILTERIGGGIIANEEMGGTMTRLINIFDGVANSLGGLTTVMEFLLKPVNAIVDAYTALGAVLGDFSIRITDLVSGRIGLAEFAKQVKNLPSVAEEAIREIQSIQPAALTAAVTTAGATAPTTAAAAGAGGAAVGVSKAEAEKGTQIRLDAEKQLQIDLAVLREQASLAFTLDLNQRAAELMAAGVEEVQIAAFVQESQTAFASEQMEARKQAEIVAAEERKQRILTEGSIIQASLLGIADRFESTREALIEGASAMMDAFSSGLSNAISSVFESFGRGEKINAKKIFGGLLSAIGQAAIAQGTFAILAGAAQTLLGSPGGPALIAAGTALVAFGGATAATGAALSKGGGAGAGATSGAGTQGFGGGAAAFGDNQGLARQGGPSITLTVNALDPAQVDWDDLAENEIGPALEGVVDRGGSQLATQPTA